MILKPLQRIQVIDSSKMCKGGSLGYFIAQGPVGRYNAWNMSILFTRFGKAGKPRLYPLPVNTRMINYDTLTKADKIIVNTVKFYDGLEPRPHINKDGHQESNIGTTLLKPISMEHKNLLDFPDNEFTAYVIALSIFIRKLTSRTSITGLHRAPVLGFVEFANNGFNFASINSEYIGYYILHGLRFRDDEKKIGIANGKGRLFAESYAERIGNRAGRKELLSKLHMSLAMSKNMFMRYNKLTSGCFSNTEDKINDILRHYKRNKKELAFVKKDESFRAEGIVKAAPIRDARVPVRKGRMKLRRKLA